MNEKLKKAKYLYSFLRKRIVHVNLQLLYNCNFKCDICDFWKQSFVNKPSFSVSQIQVISERLKWLGPQIISIGGGEPLLHKDLVEITNILAENNFPVMICNGWYVNSENAKAIFKAGMHEVSISIDYVDSEKHDRQRGKKGAFNRAIQALKILNENRYYPHQRVHMISVVMDNNLHEIEPLIQLSEDLGVTYLVTLYSQGRGKRNQKYSSQEIDTYLLGLKRKYGNFVSLTGYLSKFSNAVENGDSNYPCYAGKNLMNIDCQGDVSLCIDSLDQKIGNILNDDIFDLKDRLNQTQSNNRCSRCWTSCRGSIETLMYGDQRIRNLMDLYQMTKKVKTKN